MLPIRAIVVALLLLAPGFAGAQSNHSPHQRAILAQKSPPPPAATFGFDLPAGPQFTEAEKEAQRQRGRELLPLIRKAFDAGAAEIRVPPGDYRFAPERQEGGRVVFPLAFNDMRRDEAHPFLIDATGVTLWFDLGDAQMPPGHRCVGFRNCRNIVLRGAIIDRGTRGCIEGRITRIDRAGNRLEIEPSPGIVVPANYKGGGEQRVLPFKSDGRFCAPLYDLQPGIHKLDYKDITPSAEGRYWVNLRDPDLMDRIHNADWERVYGDLGVLRVGDGLSCLYTSTVAIALEDSAHVTLHGVSVYVAKGGPSESGGDGGHLWKDCYFGPRPGTSQWKGADGYLCRSTRYGATLDNVTIRHTADDLMNFHGIWGKVKTVAGNTVTFETNAALRPTLNNARPGDRLRFIHRKTGVSLGEARLVAARDFVVTLDQDATPFAEGQAAWPEHECAGWTVQNCRWEDSFQRLLIMSGPGTVRGCTFVRWGSGVSLNTGMGLVGGIPSDITIADNTFIDVNPRPNGATIDARAHNALGQDGVPPIDRLVITGNTFIRCGGAAIELAGIRHATLADNRFESPLVAAALVRQQDLARHQPIVLRRCTAVDVRSCTMKDTANQAHRDPQTGSTLIGLDQSQNITLDGAPLHDVSR
jgi:hypothetical protein